MQVNVSIGQNHHFALREALLIYRSTEHQNGSLGNTFISHHEVNAVNRAKQPTLGPAKTLTIEFVQSLVQALGGRVQAEFLPESVIARTERLIAWWTPPQKRSMFFGTTQGDMAGMNGAIFPQPALVWLAMDHSLSVRALKENRRPAADTKLCVAPYWNVYDTGSVCLGSMRAPDASTVASIPQWEQSFYESEFTHGNVGSRMSAAHISRPSPRLEDLLRSHRLPQLIAFMEALPVLREFMPNQLQVRLVADANRIHAELRWRLRKRHQPDHRSAIHESIEAGVAVFLAPEYVKQEIEKYYEAIATDTRSTVAEVQKEWTQFQQYVGFYAPQEHPSSSETYADIKDFPYVATWREVDARAIYTADPHLAAMGAAVVSVFIDTQLRDYARASTVQIAVRIGSSLSVFVGWESLCAMYRLLVRLIHVIRRLPPAAQAALAAAGTLAVLHPKSREAIREGWNSLKNSKAVSALCNTFVDLGVQAAEAEEKARTNFERLQAVLPARQKRPLVQHARSVCAAARSALTLEELERRIRRGGYEIRSKSFRQYLRRVLLSDDSIIQVAPGQWAVRATQARPYELSQATRHRAASRLPVEPSTGV